MASGITHFFHIQNPEGILGFTWNMKTNEIQKIENTNTTGIQISSQSYYAEGNQHSAKFEMSAALYLS